MSRLMFILANISSEKHKSSAAMSRMMLYELSCSIMVSGSGALIKKFAMFFLQYFVFRMSADYTLRFTGANALKLRLATVHIFEFWDIFNSVGRWI